jgi:uroporphyrinogen decarboxylase
MNKRDSVLGVLHDSTPPAYIPAGFFIHFDPSCHFGQPAIDKHLEFFNYTGMDFVKIQYENTFPHRPEIAQATDWAQMPLYGRDFYTGQLHVVEGLVEAAGGDAPVIVTVYSPFMCAGHTVGSQVLDVQMRENPDAVKKGMEIITESLMIFVKACIDLGVDGFYASTQGNERFRFDDPAIFRECIAPYDLTLMHEMERACHFNILHICDYHGGYDDWQPFLDYPGHLVNCSPQLGQDHLSPQQIADFFDRPYMGGVERKGVIATGTPADVEALAAALVAQAPARYFLGADCTLPNDVNWDNIRAAIDVAHRRGG